MKVRYRAEKSGRPDRPVKVNEYISLDGSRSYWYSGNGKFCKSIAEALNYIRSRRKEVKESWQLR